MSTPPSSSTWLRWAKRLLVLGAIGMVAFVALTLVLSRFLDPENLAARLEPRLEAVLSRDVEIEGVDVGLFPLGVRLRNVSVADPTGLAPSLGRVGAIELRVEFFPLLRRQVRVGRLVLENPAADLRVAMDGRSNFGDLSPQASQGEETGAEDQAPEGFNLELKGIRVSGGEVRFQSEKDSTSVEVVELRLRAAVRHDVSGPWVFVGDSQGDLDLAGKGAPSGLERLPFTLSFDLEAGPAFEDLEVRSGSLGLDPVALGISGRIGGLKEPVRDLSLGLKGEGLSIDRLVAALAGHFGFDLPGRPRGTLAADLRVEGGVGPGTTPLISGTVTVTGGGLVARDGTLVAQDLAVDLQVADTDRVRFQIAGELLDGPLSLTGTGDLSGRGSFDFDLEANPDLALVGSAVDLPEGVAASGRLDTRARGSGSPRDFRSLRLWGNASLDGVHFTHPALGVPVDLPRGRVSLVGNGATFVDLPLSLGTDDLVVTGEIQDILSYGLPYRTVGVRGTVRGPRLDLTKLSTKPPPDPELTYGKVAFARLGGRPVGSLSPEAAARELRLSRPDSLPVVGELQLALDTVIYSKGRIEDFRARMEFGPSLVRITEASLRRFGGEIWASMNMALGDRIQEPFSLTLRIRELNAAAFLQAYSPLGNAVRGKLSMDMELVGGLDGLLLPDGPSLVGSGQFSLTGGGLSSVPLTQALSSFMGITEIREPGIRDWASSFILENGRIRLADGRLAGTPGEPIVGGSLGFGGDLDLLSVFEINADNLGAYALENLGIKDDLAGRIAGRPGMVRAFVRIGGNLLAPSLRADPGATTQALAQGVREEVQAEAQRQIQQQRTQLQNRATGFLRGFLQPRDTARGTAPDSVGVDTLPPDSIPPDTVRSDSLRGDSLRPDTIRPDTVRPDTLRPDTVPPDTVQDRRPRRGTSPPRTDATGGDGTLARPPGAIRPGGRLQARLRR